MSIRKIASLSPSRSLARKGLIPSLEQFVQRQRVIHLWRDIARSLNKIPRSDTRDEMRKFARDEFDRHRHVQDLTHIRYLISTGKTQFDSIKRYIEEQVS